MRNIGIEAEDAIQLFLTNLGYEIEDWRNEEYDIDGIIIFPDETLGLINPIYAPNGLTAIEISDTQLRSIKVNKFSEKIQNYNRGNDDNPINGGIILTQGRVGRQIRNDANEKGIYCWGTSRKAFYNVKSRVFRDWVRKNRTIETKLNDYVSYLRMFSIDSSDLPLIYISVFCDSNKRISSRNIKDIIQQIYELDIRYLVQKYYIPFDTHMEFHFVEGFSMSMIELERNLERYGREGVNIKVDDDGMKSYRTFPEIRI